MSSTSSWEEPRHCPYEGCSLGCFNVANHRAKFAAMNLRTKSRQPSEETPKSPKINWDAMEEALSSLESEEVVVEPAVKTMESN